MIFASTHDQLAALPAAVATSIMPAIVPAPRHAAEPTTGKPATGPTTGELAAADQAAAAAAQAHPHRPEHLARPASPVGRANTTPALADPLRRLAARLGRPLADLSECTDAELHAITAALLEEKHRRAARWFDTA